VAENQNAITRHRRAMIISADDQQAMELRFLEGRVKPEVDDDDGFAFWRAEVDEVGH
jgi:hypothetical protein